MSAQSYSDMLVEANETRWIIHNICAGISTWFLLAAFLIIPATFTSFRDSSLFQNANQADNVAVVKDILRSVAHVGLLWVAVVIYLVGLLGYLSLWRIRRQNYTWLVDKLFLCVSHITSRVLLC
jgi:predicted histidine transporter YuiF (NhaC family)